MNAMDHAIREKANQMGSALWSLAVALIVGFILWMSGSGVPWWVYPILFDSICCRTCSSAFR